MRKVGPGGVKGLFPGDETSYANAQVHGKAWCGHRVMGNIKLLTGF